MSGIGYNGRGPNGEHRWDMVSNVDVVGVEVGQCVGVGVSGEEGGIN